MAHGNQFPDQGSNPAPLYREHRVLATGPPGNSLFIALNVSLLQFLAASCKFWYSVFLFSFVSRHALLSLVISSLTHWLFVVCCLMSTYL